MRITMKKNSGYIIGFAVFACLVVILLFTCNHRKNVIVIERENTMLRHVNKTLTDEVAKSQDKILILEKK